MRRRAFISLLGGAVATWPIAARAQQPASLRPLIGMLSPLSATAAHNNAAFRSALRDLGYVEGRNAVAFMILCFPVGSVTAEEKKPAQGRRGRGNLLPREAHLA